MEKIIVDNVSKTIGGARVLDRVSLRGESGKVYGLVGTNGAGKTMLIRAIAGLMRIDEGTISTESMVLHKDVEVFPSVGLILENVGLYPEFSGFDNLSLLSRINHRIGKEEIRRAITRVGLDPDDKRPIRKYSLGMKQRIVLAQAIMEEPELLLLDEPTNALDESGIELIRNIIREEQKRGAIIFLASHSREDIDLLCDEIYIMEKGRLKEQA